MNNRFGSVIGGAFALTIFFIVGGVFTGIAAFQLKEYFESSEWPAAEGNITHLSIDEDYDSDSGYTYRANIQYEFMVNGVEYYGNRYQFGGDIYSGDRGRAENVIENYETGDDVLVYYNPDAPEANVLLREVDWLLWLFFGIGVILLLVGLAAAVNAVLGGFRRQSAQLGIPEQDLQSGDYLLENEKFKL